MNTTFQYWIDPIGWTLLHSLWQAAAIAILARGVIGAVRSRSASFGAMVHAVALAAVLVAAGATCAIKMRLKAPVPELALAQPGPARAEMAVKADLPEIAALQRELPRDLFPMLVAGWAAGVALMSLRWVAGALWLRRLRRSAIEWADEAWQARFRHWLGELGLRRAVRLCTTLAHETPAVIGHFKPLVLLPAALVTRLAPEQLEAVILHELMHIRRHDYLVNFLRVAAETVLFFNPAVWWISRAIRVEREVACDQLVAEHTGNKIGYARTLLRLEELHLAETGGLALAASSGPLKTRIARLLAVDRPAPALAAWTGAGCLLLLIAGLAAFGLPRTFAADAAPALFQLRSVVESGTADSEMLGLVRASSTGELSTNQLAVAKAVLLDQSHFAEVKLAYDPVANRPEIDIRLTPEGAALFAKITEQHVGRQIAIVIDGKVISAPRVNERIGGGALRISGAFTEDEARDLVGKLSPKKRAEAETAERIAATAWTPPPGSLPSRILEEARADRAAGRYAEALAKHVWYHTASRQEAGQGGVRLSFALTDWLALGQVYPPALAKMKELRAETEQALRNGGAEADRFTLFHEYSGFNWVLKEEQKTVELYRSLREQDAAFDTPPFRQVADAAFGRILQVSRAEPERDFINVREPYRYVREQYHYYSGVLEQLKALESKGALRKTLTVVLPDAQLDRLFADLAQAEQKLAQLTTDFSGEHPEVLKVKAVIKVINGQIDERIDAIMKGLEIRVSSAKASVEELEKLKAAKIQKF